MPDGSDGHMLPLRDGAMLWVDAQGQPEDGLPGLVFLHGGAGMWDYLGPVADLAATSFRTVRYDQWSCGRSSPDEDYSIARYVADLDELREHFGYERWYVFGHSFGATLGIEYAATHGHRVAGLVYCSGLGIGWSTHRAAYKAQQEQRLTTAERTRLNELAAKTRTWDEEVEWRTLSWLPDFVDPERAREWAAADANTPLPLNLACNRAFNAETNAWTAEDEIGRWGAVTCPVWIIHGEGDPRPADGPRTLASILPNAGFHEIADAGHQPWRERPNAIGQVLAAVAAHASETS